MYRLTMWTGILLALVMCFAITTAVLAGPTPTAVAIHGVIGGSASSDPSVAASLVTIDSNTGIGTVVGTPIPGTGLTGLIAVDGRLIASTSEDGGPPRLIDNDPTTGLRVMDRGRVMGLNAHA